ncbi:hypothetical protein C900_03770 [Fulvivirga imtechensis AK7]|uniref:Uncharacterized protein n=1 Tax=Fulvivirga imtechensis AK7 TaxID=1237149 RepID=L8JN94_9BACT|nr:hypothetical protein C900_03770 [Fulvivirga imtechensis AK7]
MSITEKRISVTEKISFKLNIMRNYKKTGDQTFYSCFSG